ncbi:transmembrane protein, putative [Medicago truncatula]|uniref:Transmembrane protein, putative n=1 Tax=Medicago truncatula TaxID=3880 RepID=G7KEY0_MEDTR|nr:transmembrane protein, putative [Medicago truncatula]
MHGDIEEARRCFLASKGKEKAIESTTNANMVELDYRFSKMSLKERRPLQECTDRERTFRTGSSTVDQFGWSAIDMPVIVPEVACHRLNLQHKKSKRKIRFIELLDVAFMPAMKVLLISALRAFMATQYFNNLLLADFRKSLNNST